MTDINLEIARLVQYGVKKGLLHQEDAVFAVNRILALLKLNDYTRRLFRRKTWQALSRF